MHWALYTLVRCTTVTSLILLCSELHTTQCILQWALLTQLWNRLLHSVLHTALCILHCAYCIVHTAQCTEHCILWWGAQLWHLHYTADQFRPLCTVYCVHCIYAIYCTEHCMLWWVAQLWNLLLHSVLHTALCTLQCAQCTGHCILWWGSQLWQPGPSEYPVLEQNSDFFVLLEPYSEIFGKWPSSE